MVSQRFNPTGAGCTKARRDQRRAFFAWRRLLAKTPKAAKSGDAGGIAAKATLTAVTMMAA